MNSQESSCYTIYCPRCEERLLASMSSGGFRGVCPKCSEPFRFPFPINFHSTDSKTLYLNVVEEGVQGALVDLPVKEEEDVRETGSANQKSNVVTEGLNVKNEVSPRTVGPSFKGLLEKGPYKPKYPWKENDWLYYRICRQCGGSEGVIHQYRGYRTYNKVVQRNGFLWLGIREASVCVPEPRCTHCSSWVSSSSASTYSSFMFYSGVISFAAMLGYGYIFYKPVVQFSLLFIFIVLGIGFLVLAIGIIIWMFAGGFCLAVVNIFRSKKDQDNQRHGFNPIVNMLYDLGWHSPNLDSGEGSSLNKKLTDSEVDVLAAQCRQEAIDIFSDYMLWSESQAFFVKGEARREKD
ncbi:MAG: hypothetical protein MPJ24_06630 [Pirellulaceae bacterium]|nr:hypothetical protein [Pirellulaceae bacterium]